MELLNATGMQAGYTLGMQPDGRELLVVAVKGTFTIPKPGAQTQLAEEQIPLVEADTFTGEPGFSAPLYEVDYAPRKPYCDVLLVGSAYAPEGKPSDCVQVRLKLGAVDKRFNVFGDRLWKSRHDRISISSTSQFTVMPITYDRAFGGTDNFHPDETKHTAYMPNPIGKGYHQELLDVLVDGTPLPNIEEMDKPIKKPDDLYRPMAFGPLGRGWEPRLKFAGTYDDHWLADVFPFLPADFNEAYYQAAPLDQQIPSPTGGEEVVLENLTPDGFTTFHLPKVDVPIVFFRKHGDKHETQGVIDTLVIEPDKGLFTMTWRATLPLKKNIFEIPQVLAGKKSRAWWRARELGKEYYPSLAALIASRRKEAEEEAE